MSLSDRERAEGFREHVCGFFVVERAEGFRGRNSYSVAHAI